MKHIKLYEDFSMNAPENTVEFVQSGNSRFFEGDIEGITHEIRPANHIVGDSIEIYEVPEWNFANKGQISGPVKMGKIIDISDDNKVYTVEILEVNESFWSDIFGKPTVKDAAKDSLRGQGWSQMGRDDSQENYIVFGGDKFYPDQIEYDDVNSTKPIPRVENGKLIVANPVWSM